MGKVATIDLFCGAGGLTHGFKLEDMNVVAGFDIDASCKYAYEENNDATFFAEDVSGLTKSTLEALYGDSDTKVLIGCAPCQPFSTYNAKKGDKGKWNLLTKFGELIKELQPDIISMENVPNLVNFKKYPVYEQFLEVLRENGYYIDANVVFCPDYGIPQNRKRLVLLASKLGQIRLMAKTHKPDEYKTVEQTIGHLAPIGAGGFDPKDPLHRSRRLSKKNEERILHTDEGCGWENWPEHLKLECHKRESGKTYKNVYGRMNRKEPAPTLTTYCTNIGNGMFGHYEQNRAISAREAALLQTFPEKYKFIDPSKPFSMEAIARQIGNAVPVQLGRVIALSIKEHLSSNGHL